MTKYIIAVWAVATVVEILWLNAAKRARRDELFEREIEAASDLLGVRDLIEDAHRTAKR